MSWPARPGSNIEHTKYIKNNFNPALDYNTVCSEYTRCHSHVKLQVNGGF